MRVGVIGINHKSACLQVREAVTRAMAETVQSLSVVFLSTCHRTEIYFSEADLVVAHSRILNELQKRVEVAFEHALYSYFGHDCFLHLAAVTAGLDSVIQGESEIQRQVKEAYRIYKNNLPSVLHFLFQKSLKLGKEMRTRFPIFSRSSNLEGTVKEIGRHFFADFSQVDLLLIGNSDINRKILKRLDQKMRRIVLATRYPNSAKIEVSGRCVDVTDTNIIQEWGSFDWVVCATQAQRYCVFGSGAGAKTRLILDLSMPRTVDPVLGRYPQLTLFNIEQIGQLMERRKEEIGDIQKAIMEGVAKQIHLYQGRQCVCLSC